MSDPVVATTNTARQYYVDLQDCRDRVARRMGAPAATDDVAALKRALADDDLGDTLRVHYTAGDLSYKRDKAVKSCLRKKGYIVRL